MPFMGVVDGGENAVVFRNDEKGLDLSGAMVMMEELNSCTQFYEKGKGKTCHRPHNNQPLTLILNTVVAPQ
jgi:hypothetical protein